MIEDKGIPRIPRPVPKLQEERQEKVYGGRQGLAMSGTTGTSIRNFVMIGNKD